MGEAKGFALAFCQRFALAKCTQIIPRLWRLFLLSSFLALHARKLSLASCLFLCYHFLDV